MERSKKLQGKKTCAYRQIQQETDDATGRLKMSKEEKKARRILLQLNIIPMLGFRRVVMRRTDNTLIIIDDPELYRPHNSDTYIIFGVPRCQEPLEQAQQTAAQRYKFADFLLQNKETGESTTDSGGDDDGDDHDGKASAAGLNENDIDLIMSQCKVNRKKAIKAYKEHNYDLVNAIMHLTK